MAYSPRSTEPGEDVGPLLAQANELVAKNDLGGARDVLERAISLQPKNQKVQSLLGMTCFRLGHHERASELYELLVRENPVEPTLRVNLGLVYLKMNHLPLAIREFQTTVDLAPEHKKAHNYLGLSLAQAGEHAAAREAFIAAGSVAMVEKMDRLIAEQSAAVSRPITAPPGAPVPVTGPALAQRGFAEIEPTEPHELEGAQRPSTAPMGMPAGLRPGTQERPTIPAQTVQRPSTMVIANLLPLSELAQALRIDAIPPAPFEVRGEIAAIRVAGEVLTRTDPLVGITGEVSMSPEMKRFRGRATDKSFGKGRARFVRASGHGMILVATQGKTFLPVELADGAAYFNEDAVFAFEEPLTFENGRLPGKSGPDLNLLHLRGRGKALLQLRGPLRSLAVAADAPAVVALGQLVGWLGSLTPKLLAPLPEADGDQAPLAVELTGEGFALLMLPEASSAHGRNG